jgi:hypothetical protein
MIDYALNLMLIVIVINIAVQLYIKLDKRKIEKVRK